MTSVNNSDSLVARALKAKYYPNSDFLESGLESQPSYLWRSIWATKGLMCM